MNEIINNLIKEKNISIYKLAKESGVPYMTLNDICNSKTDICKCSAITVYKLAQSLSTSIEVLLGVKPANSGFSASAVTDASAASASSLPARTWAETRRKKYVFPVMEDCKNASFDIWRIHPLKQRSLFKISEVLKKDGRCESAIVFGSSCGIRCGAKSDIDICLALDCLSQSCPDILTVKEINEIKNDISEMVQEACNFDADILWADHISSGSVIDNNIKMGVELL